jgi:cytochrome c biogenesis protein CcmG/thiol:disulfide interchange protein DsbE
VLGVDVQDVSSDALNFVDQFQLSYPMLKDRESDVSTDYGVAGLPETFVIDRKGRISAARRGPVDETFMREQVSPLLLDKGE